MLRVTLVTIVAVDLSTISYVEFRALFLLGQRRGATCGASQGLPAIGKRAGLWKRLLRRVPSPTPSLRSRVRLGTSLATTVGVFGGWQVFDKLRRYTAGDLIPL